MGVSELKRECAHGQRTTGGVPGATCNLCPPFPAERVDTAGKARNVGKGHDTMWVFAGIAGRAGRAGSPDRDEVLFAWSGGISRPWHTAVGRADAAALGRT